ncbi:hypothetical protein SLA2020_201460 [Shorea laevis]
MAHQTVSPRTWFDISMLSRKDQATFCTHLKEIRSYQQGFRAIWEDLKQEIRDCPPVTLSGQKFFAIETSLATLKVARIPVV